MYVTDSQLPVCTIGDCFTHTVVREILPLKSFRQWTLPPKIKHANYFYEKYFNSWKFFARLMRQKLDYAKN